MKFEIGQQVLVKHPKHRASLIGEIKTIEDNQALVKLFITINNCDEYWFALTTLRRFEK